VLSVYYWPLCCLSIIGHCVVCLLLAIVLSVYYWSLCCLSSIDLRLLVIPLVSSKTVYVPPQMWKNKRIVKPSSVWLCWLLCAFQSISQKLNIFCFACLWHLTRIWQRVTRMCRRSCGGRTTPERSMRFESLSFIVRFVICFILLMYAFICFFFMILPDYYTILWLRTESSTFFHY